MELNIPLNCMLPENVQMSKQKTNFQQIFIHLSQTFGITLAFKFRKKKFNVNASIVKSQNLFLIRTQQNAASREVSLPGSFFALI